jgi:putative glycosyl hydrolase
VPSPSAVPRLVACAVGVALLSPAQIVSPPASTAPTALEHERPSARRIEARGVGAWLAPGVDQSLRRSRVSWVYNWGPQPTFTVPQGVRFVPTIWGPAFLTPANLALAKTYGPDLLTFNEPELGSQANMRVGQAVRLWPALEATGMRLSSPAVTGDARDRHGWLAAFMRKAQKRGLRVDFLALHWYAGKLRPDTVDHLRRYLTELHRKYDRPIWLTELAIVAHNGYGHLMYPSQRVQARFAAQATRMLDRLPFVERYAWFALSAPAKGRSSGLYRPDSTATAVGRAYRR